MIEKEIDYNGIWWLPDKPDEQICGNLKLSPWKGADLSLSGVYSNIAKFAESRDRDIILGYSGKKITLYNCFWLSHEMSNSFETIRFYCLRTFVGEHFQSPKDIKFKSVQVHYSNIDNWLSQFGMESDKSAKEKDVILKYHQPKSIKLGKIGNFEISIFFGFSHETNLKKFHFEQKAYIVIESKEGEKLFSEYEEEIRHIQHFLVLGCGSPVYPLDIEGETEAHKMMIHGKNYYPPIKIYYRVPNYSESINEILSFRMDFTYKDISKNFKDILSKWFQSRSLLDPVYDLYFKTIYNSSLMTREQRFLNLTQGIEAYHRRRYEGKYISDEQYKKEVYGELIDAIPGKLKSDFKESLKTKMVYLNEYSLRKRLKEIISKCNEFSGISVLPHPEEFVEDVANTRNFLTHYDKNLEKKAKNGIEMISLSNEMELLLKICFLHEIGISKKLIKKVAVKYRSGHK